MPAIRDARITEAMGGRLEIVARFPDPAVRIRPFEALDPEGRPQGWADTGRGRRGSAVRRQA